MTDYAEMREQAERHRVRDDDTRDEPLEDLVTVLALGAVLIGAALWPWWVM